MCAPRQRADLGETAAQAWSNFMSDALLAEKLGFSEAWVGEHYTAPWEPNPSPDLLIAQALMETKQIVLAPGAHLLPYHHPAELACRVAFMDHLAQGRYMFGIGASGLPSDWQLFSVDGMKPRHGMLKVIDFGLARLQPRHDQLVPIRRLTRIGTVMGTPDFIAPEQLEDPRNVDIRADLYSLGCTFYFLLTGQVPFPGGTLIQKLDRQRWHTAPGVNQLRPEIPPALAAVAWKSACARPPGPGAAT